MVCFSDTPILIFLVRKRTIVVVVVKSSVCGGLCVSDRPRYGGVQLSLKSTRSRSNPSIEMEDDMREKHGALQLDFV